METDAILTKWGISINEMETYSKSQWKKFVNDKVNQLNENELKENIRNYSKVKSEEIEDEKCEIKEYIKQLPYDDALLRFRIRTDMVWGIRCHWKNDSTHEEELWKCWHCS